MTEYIVREFQERRIKQEPIPNHLERFLNKLQMTALLQLEALGWQLWFVRRPLFQPVMPVLCDPSGSFTAILEEDGSSNIDHGYVFRDQ
jgi:hypothetical protein